MAMNFIHDTKDKHEVAMYLLKGIGVVLTEHSKASLSTHVLRVPFPGLS